jgi:hypothetical protein
MADTTEINGAQYEFEYKLSNSDGELKFNDTTINTLEIIDNFFSPFLSGSVTLANPFNFIESELLLKGDGTDIFYIKLNPVDDKESVLEHEFVIIGEQNLIDDGTALKNKKVYFLDSKDAYALRAVFPYSKKYRGKGGDIIKDILKAFEFPVDEEMEPGDFIVKDNPEFIIPSLAYRYSDLLYYILQRYYYIDGDLGVKGFLRKVDNKYTMQIISKLYSENQKNVIETFTSADLSTDSKSNPNNHPQTADIKQYISEINSNDIKTPFTSISNAYYMNTLVSGYNPILGESELIEVRLEETRDKWKEKFVDVFTSIGGKVDSFLNLNDIKIGKGFKILRLPGNTSDNAKIVEAGLVNDFIFLNMQLNLTVVGDTKRQAGKFIDIFKLKNENIDSDKKMLGRWFMTSVRHVKILNTYRNEIFCTKTYTGPG